MDLANVGSISSSMQYTKWIISMLNIAKELVSKQNGGRILLESVCLLVRDHVPQL